jgi:microcystin-dependent protein
MSDFFLGQIMMTGFGYPQKGFALCNGQTLGISQNNALFALLGTSYGGNGTTNFMLPNLQGRSFYGAGNSVDSGWQPSPLPTGAVGGTETVTVTTTNLPIHNHLLNGTNVPGVTTRTAANMLLGKAAHAMYGPPGAGPVQLAPATLQTAPANGGTAHANVQPLQVINFNIALTGIFPSRN